MEIYGMGKVYVQNISQLLQNIKGEGYEKNCNLR